MNSWAMEVIADSSGKWVGNQVRFATKVEAEDYANYKFRTWTLVRETRVVASNDPVNYRWDPSVAGGLVATSPAKGD